jgi:23S rRNA (adenine2503-C2)-methyltransferase
MRDACQLVELVRGMNCHINLISINAIEGGIYRRVPVSSTMAFRDALNNRGVTATIRRELGNDINASCGQLRRGFYNE